MEVHEDLRELMELFLSNRITAEQHTRLVRLIGEPGSEAILEGILKESFYGPGDRTEDSMEEALHYLGNLKARMNAVPAHGAGGGLIRLRKWAGWAAAAVLLLAAGSAYLLLHGRDKDALPQALRFRNDVGPGGDKAILTLADGSRITLDSVHNGNLAVQGNTTVYKKDGALSYQAVGKTQQVYNTVSTPAKGQYRLTLADGTGVWLDALSSIRFPTAFSGGDREVQVTGQVYFEVRADPEHPFRVRVNDETVAALGTRFNINAYKDEPAIRTTLAEGLVRVHRDNDSVSLHPGQQAAAAPGGTLDVLGNQDMEEILAWKDGLFHFNGTNTEMIMRQVARC